MVSHPHPFVVVEPGATQASFIEGEPQPADQVQRASGIGAQPYNVARIGWDFGPIEDDVEYGSE